MKENKKEKLIFISHRHIDRPIANFLRATHDGWLTEKDKIFQSSALGHGPEVGRELTKDLKDALSKTNLLFLIYTDSSADWGYCLWECGFADAPTSVATKFVVFECGGESHPVFNNLLRVKLEKESIKNFIKQFHTVDNFIPGHRNLRKEINEDTLNNWTDNFYEGFKKHMPQVAPEILPVWDCMVLKLKWEPVLKIMQLKETEDKKNLERAKQLILDNCLLESKRSSAIPHFGLIRTEADRPWKDILSNWKIQSKTNTSYDWIDNLHIQLYRSVLGQTQEIVKGEFISLAKQEIKRYILILTRVRRWFSGDIDFDIFFYPIIK